MSAPDFYFAVNALFRYIHDTHGRAELERYWRELGLQYYGPRIAKWKAGPDAIADDWRTYFAQEPGAEVDVRSTSKTVHLEIRTCPAIKHLRDNGREIVSYFCDHCDHVCGAMADRAGFTFTRLGGMGSCSQVFVQQ